MKTFYEYFLAKEALDPREDTPAHERRRGHYQDYGRHLDPKKDPKPFHPTWQREPNPSGSKDSLQTYIGSKDIDKYEDIDNPPFYKAMIDELILLASRHPNTIFNTSDTMEKLEKRIPKSLFPAGDTWKNIWEYLKIAEKKKDVELGKETLKVLDVPMNRKAPKLPGRQMPGDEETRGRGLFSVVDKFKGKNEPPPVGTIPFEKTVSRFNPSLKDVGELRSELLKAGKRMDKEVIRKIIRELKHRASGNINPVSGSPYADASLASELLNKIKNSRFKELV